MGFLLAQIRYYPKKGLKSNSLIPPGGTGNLFIVHLWSKPSDSLKRGLLNEAIDAQNVQNLGNPDEKLPEKPFVCARCHSLRFYGEVKDPSVENLLPDFDFDHTVGRRLMSMSRARTVSTS